MHRIKLYVFLLAICSITFLTPVQAHKRALYDIIIDTDCGVDDFRSLTYFLASRDFNINAITSVDGVFQPDVSANYIHMLLDKYQHQGIPVGQGNENGASKQYMSHAKPQWDNIFPVVTEKKFPSAVSVMHTSLKNSRRTTILVALGPLTNIAELINKHPEILPKVEQILWYTNYTDGPTGYNYLQDTAAFKFLINNNVPIKTINGGGLKYSDSFLDDCKLISNSIYAETMVKFMTGFRNLSIWDDIIPIYLLHPTLFHEQIINHNIINVTPNENLIFDVLATSILNYDKPDEGVIFNEVPTGGYMLRQDLHTHIDEILNLHGYHEFKIVALTSEIHSHLGVYSILGAKLGLRIMEYLHVGLDEVSIISYAGSRPPVSCFNDGIQVGTGATIGYGKIKVVETDQPIPAVEVIYNNRKIRFSLKEEIIADIRRDIGYLIKTYGLDSEMYWEELRKIAITDYWKKINRFEAFDIEEL